jgi:hypothetical protein
LTEQTKESGCPKCNFAHYGARFVFVDKAYTYHKTQKHWIDNKIDRYQQKLISEINKTNDYVEKYKFINW